MAKDSKRDFRSFLTAKDSKGKKWELRGYGYTPIEAAQSAMDRYRDDEKNWDCYGYIID